MRPKLCAAGPFRGESLAGLMPHRDTNGPVKAKGSDALVINCKRGDEVLERPGKRSKTTVGRLHAELHLGSWNGALQKVLGPH